MHRRKHIIPGIIATICTVCVAVLVAPYLQSPARNFLQDVQHLEATPDDPRFEQYGFTEGRCVSWNNFDTPIPGDLPQNLKGPEVRRLSDGYYFLLPRQQGDTLYISVALLCKSFPFNNRYTQGYQPSGVRYILRDTDTGVGSTVQYHGSTFGITRHLGNRLPWYVAAIVFLFLWLYLAIPQTKGGWIWPVTTLTLYLLSLGITHEQWLEERSFFAPQWYADSFWIPSFASLLILLCGIAGGLLMVRKKGRLFRLRFPVALTGLYLLYYLFHSLLHNSTIGFNLLSASAENPAWLFWVSVIIITTGMVSAIRLILEPEHPLHPIILLAILAGVTLLFLQWLPGHWLGFLSGLLAFSVVFRNRIAQHPEKWKTAFALFLSILLFQQMNRQEEMRQEQLLTGTAQRILDEEDYYLDVALPEVLQAYPDSISTADTVRLLQYLQRALPNEVRSRYTVELEPEHSPASGVGYSLPWGAFRVHLQRKYFPYGLGFPELLKNEPYTPGSDQVSYAYYFDGELKESKGGYPFPHFLVREENTPDAQQVQRHFHREHRGRRTVLSSAPHKPWQQQLSTFLILVILLITGLFHERLWPFGKQPSLQQRLQFTVSAVAIAAVLLLTAIAVQSLVRQYRLQNRQVLSEKIQSIQIELNHKLGKEGYRAILDIGYLQEILLKFSTVFFSDITLYEPDGRLLATSRPKLYGNSYLSTWMNPVALEAVHNHNTPVHVTREAIGRLQYLSAYQAFYNNDGRLLAYINLPFFARQEELALRLSALLTSMLNALLLVVIVSILLSVILANRINQPLRKLVKQLESMTLMGKNQKILVRADREIAQLVQAYNSKVEEIQNMVDELSRKERETAWKEMARQVAHEIKNPLTPIRLNAQLLERKLQSNDTDSREQTLQFLQNLVRQVDVLGTIATEFSRFAAMPKPTLGPADPAMILQESLSIFASGHQYDLEETGNKPTVIISDATHLSRICNNLIKNAVQAIEQAQSSGRIRCSIRYGESEFEVAIADNGAGIPEEIREKIFEPRFTTKSKGMGLGLAMVKNMVVQLNGHIHFTSQPGKGTCFYLRFPIKSK